MHGRPQAVYVDRAGHFGQRFGSQAKPTRMIIGTRAATLEAANRYLEEQWIPFWNERFAVAPADPLDAHRPLPGRV